MSLDLFPKPRAPKPAASVEPTPAPPEPSPAALEESEKRRSRRGTRGGRSRKADGETTEADTAPLPEAAEVSEPEVETPAPEAEPVAPARRPRRTRAVIAAEAAAAAETAALAAEAPAEVVADAPEETPVSQDAAVETEADAAEARIVEAGEQADDESADRMATEREPRRRDRRGSRGGRGRGGDRSQPNEENGRPMAEAPSVEGETRQPEPQRQGGGRPQPASGEPRLDSLVRAIENQGRQIEQLVRIQSDDRARKTQSPNGAPPPRVGIFVDVANIELAADRQRVRLDWARILALLTRDRQLVRAIAYSPVHDDPSVSVETQRFVEPFLDRGYKIVTKPLKRFQDGSIKANVDIELALDVVTMVERLDIVCLVSGDGDFEKLVELVQGKGIRVEVISFGSSTAGNLKNAADAFIDLQARLRDVRL